MSEGEKEFWSMIVAWISLFLCFTLFLAEESGVADFVIFESSSIMSLVVGIGMGLYFKEVSE